MAAGDLVIARFNEGLFNFQGEENTKTVLSAAFPTSLFDVINYDFIYRGGGQTFQRGSTMVTGISKS